MKFWIKILVALGVVLVIAFGVWAFWFQESDEVQAYNKCAELIDYKQSLALNSKLESLRNMNYISNNSELVIGTDSDSKNNIHLYRSICLSAEPITSSSNLEYPSYMVMDDYIDEYLESYLPYLNSSRTKMKQRNAVKDAINNYSKSLKLLNEEIDNVSTYQKDMTDESVQYDILCKYYENFYNTYRKCVNRASGVMLAMVEYIDVCSYSDNIKLDANFAMGDALARLINTSTTVGSVDEPKYASDVKVLLDTIDKVDGGEYIFENGSEYDFLSSYNDLYNNRKNVLNQVFGSNKEKKQQMAEGVSLSDIETDAQEKVVIVLKVLGY